MRSPSNVVGHVLRADQWILVANMKIRMSVVRRIGLFKKIGEIKVLKQKGILICPRNCYSAQVLDL